MSPPVIAMFVLQWVAIVVFAGLLLVLFRQVGMLHERLGPVGALTLPGGVRIGGLAPQFELASLNGGTIRIGGATTDGRSTFLFFLSPTCTVCKSMLPIILSLARENAPDMQTVFASDGDHAEQLNMIAREKLSGYPFVLSADLGRAHAIGKLPYAVLLGTDGRLVAKGLVNNREHVESLFNAQTSTVATLQDFVAQRQRTAGAAA